MIPIPLMDCCVVSFDRSVCNVYYTTNPGTYDDAEQAFAKAGGRIRSILAKKLSWRTSPELRFFLDDSVDEAQRIPVALANERSRMHEDEVAQDDGDIADPKD